MESGHGVRASAVSTRYSHDDEQMSIASDQETADGSLRKPGPPVFEGDLSEWGRTALENFYDEDDQSISSSHPTMSSGISPRDTQQRVKPFDLEAARETLAYNAGMFSRAQALRRDGTAPAALGIADDLPDRMAYQQLNILAGMAGKVQDAILHNKRIFEQRMMQQDRALLRKVLGGWRAVRYGSVAKQALLRRAAARIGRGALARAFFAWKDELHLVDRNLAMKRKVAATIARGLMKRSFLAWQRLAQERWWKNQLVMREREVALLEGKIRGFEKRPIQVLQKRRMRATMQAWFAAAAGRREKRLAMARAGRFWAKQQLGKAWNSWVDHVETSARRRVLSQKVVARCKQLELAAAWNSWQEVVVAKQAKQIKLTKAAKQWHQALESRAWRSWQDAAAQAKARRKIAARWMQPAKARVLSGWLDYVEWKQRSRLVVGRALAKLRHGMMATAFLAWLEEAQAAKLEATLATKQGTEESLAKLQAENERLRRDNERFVRLIDSGEWGRGRVAELVSAGEVMRGERDALLKLIGSLRREFEAVAAAKGCQEDELRLLKEKMTVGGPARNRLLVKGGSSFNALVRAMKQDLIDNGTAAKDPALLYEIDKARQRFCVHWFSCARSADSGRPVSGKPRPAGYSSSTPSMRGTLAGSSSSSSPKPGASLPGRHSSPYSPSAAAAAAAGRPSWDGAANVQYESESLHSTLSVEAGARSPGGAAVQGPAMSTQRVLQALSGLSPAQVDQLEAAVKAGAATTAGAGSSSSSAAAAVTGAAALRSAGRRPGY
ncbi:hypothetical protein OEZ85_006293 [Tetradesmus obliquus]|uniref:Sfi1 spindle body domain-containing protein n=1 Tax=Tetradesmus obliquus TaxID=3088 RepID=A0ABY8TU44_TETOB|nr:hypothetical protein OEZ85_006293 [Tetradesmus obliquus]